MRIQGQQKTHKMIGINLLILFSVTFVSWAGSNQPSLMNTDVLNVKNTAHSMEQPSALLSGVDISPAGPAKQIIMASKIAVIRSWSEMMAKKGAKQIISAEDQYSVFLKSGRITPIPGLSPALRQYLLDETADTSQTLSYVYVYVLCAAPLQESLANNIKANGAEIIGLCPPNTYITRISVENCASLSSNQYVRAMFQLSPQQKLDTKLVEQMTRASETEDMPVAISLFADDASGAVRNVLLKAGMKISAYHKDIKAVMGTCNKLVISEIAKLAEVQYIEWVAPKYISLSTSVGYCNAIDVRSLSSHYGANVIVGIIDSGFQFGPSGTGHDAFLEQSGYPASWGLGWNVSGDGVQADVWNDPNGHGTHVLGIILSRWASVSLAGVCPWLGGDSSHQFRAVRCGKNDGSRYLYNLDDAIDNISSDNQALVINNSWGSDDNTGNTVESRLVDASTWNNNQFWVFAAGNDGTAAGTISSPGAAKNILAVGGLNNNSSLGLYAYSSMGPTADGRFKPEIYAPANPVVSANAHNLHGSISMSGTSMATPHVTAIAASLMDHYSTLQRRPAALKAFLIASARRLSSISDHRAGIIDSYRSHFTTSDSKGTWSYYDASISQDGQVYFDWSIGSGDYSKMYVVLTWIEPAPSASAGECVNNDIDLYVDYNADGSDEWSSSSGGDNYEFVEITDPSAGTYRFTAYGWSIAGDSRLGFGVAVKGAETTTTTTRTTTSTTTSTSRTTTRSSTTTSIHGSVSLGDAVDASQLTWTTGGDADWFGQTATTHDGVDAAQSGAITDSQSSWMETTVTGLGTISFWWKVSSEGSWDYLRFYISGFWQTDISGTVDWQQSSFSVPAGTQILQWQYVKDGSLSSGSDCGWVDQVVWTPSSSTTSTSRTTTRTTTSSTGTTTSSIGTTTRTTTRTTTSSTRTTTSSTSSSTISSSTTTSILSDALNRKYAAHYAWYTCYWSYITWLNNQSNDYAYYAYVYGYYGYVFAEYSRTSGDDYLIYSYVFNYYAYYFASEAYESIDSSDASYARFNAQKAYEFSYLVYIGQ